MFSRDGTQFILFFVLSLIGVWVVYKDLIPPTQGGFTLYDGMIAAMYWFALLLYILLSLTFGLTIRKRSCKWLLSVHLLSLSLALAATGTLVNAGHQFAAEEAQHEALNQELENGPE